MATATAATAAVTADQLAKLLDAGKIDIETVFARVESGDIPNAVAAAAVKAHSENTSKAAAAAAAKSAARGSDKPVKAELSSYTPPGKPKLKIPMVRLTGPFAPVNLSVGKCRKILANAEAVRAVCDSAPDAADDE